MQTKFSMGKVFKKKGGQFSQATSNYSKLWLIAGYNAMTVTTEESCLGNQLVGLIGDLLEHKGIECYM